MPLPRSTLFPYTTLFRSRGTRRRASPRLRRRCRPRSAAGCRRPLVPGRAVDDIRLRFEDGRSEEHTSELQSLTNLVCRLLLEKKKKNTIQIIAPTSLYIR